MSTKKKMKDIIEEQPDDATYEEILRELAFARMVERIYEKVQILNKLPEIGYRYRATREGDIRVLLYALIPVDLCTLHRFDCARR